MISPLVVRVSVASFLAGLATAFASSPPPCRDDDAAQRIDQLAREVMAAELCPGMAVAVVYGGEPLLVAGYGYADLEAERAVDGDTVFYIASTTKSFLGTASSILHRRGEVDLDGAIREALAEAHFAPGIDPSSITLRDLLTHTHGIANGGPVTFRLAYSGEHDPALLRRLLRHHGPAATGRGFVYGNLGYNLAGMVLDQVIGKPWKDLLHDEIFEPLGMASTTGYVSRIDPERLAQPYSLAPEGYARGYYAKGDANMHSAGGLVTSVRDMARWLQVQTMEGRLDGVAVLPAPAVGDAQWAHAELERQDGSIFYSGYGLGWMVGELAGRYVVGHHGGFQGFHCHQTLFPDEGIGLVVLCNTTWGIPAARVLASGVLAILTGDEELLRETHAELAELPEQARRVRASVAEDLARRAGREQTLPRPLEHYVGPFENEVLGRLRFELVEERLEARMGRLWSRVEALDAARDLLRVEWTGQGAPIQFHFKGDGPAASSVFYDGRVFERIR